MAAHRICHLTKSPGLRLRATLTLGGGWCRLLPHRGRQDPRSNDPLYDGFHAVGGSNLPRSGKLRGCLNAQDDALHMYFTCGLSDATGGDEDEPERRPEKENCGPQGSVLTGESSSC